MLTDRKPGKPHKLAHEILGLIGKAAAVSLACFFLLSGIASIAAEDYCFQNDVPMTEFDWRTVDQWIFTVSGILACICFSVLFLCLLHDRVAYIRTITRGIDSLHGGQQVLELPLEGNNELTALAKAINDMSRAQMALREQERALAEEKETLIRTLSHDIRTPLTSILGYSEYLREQPQMTQEEQNACLALIVRKAEQIRDLTAVLLDGSRRNPELFADARLLMEQLAAEFTETLEDGFAVKTDLSGCGPFGGSFDVQELRRIFDNLASNVQKYASAQHPVMLTIGTENGAWQICQSNAVRDNDARPEGFGIGLNSIRRIVQHYGGQVTVTQENGSYAIAISIPVCEGAEQAAT